MFTGLIQEQGQLVKTQHSGQTIRLTCQASRQLLVDYQIGDSMTLNGVCLTAIAKTATTFTVEVMPSTYQRTNLAHLKVNDKVNLERALQYHGRLEGHLVSGHIDGLVRLKIIRHQENAQLLIFELPAFLQGLVIPQGSIALNGVSLTVVQVTATTFSVGLIPHSMGQTNLGQLQCGAAVNVETDLLGKYINEQLKNKQMTTWEGLI